MFVYKYDFFVHYSADDSNSKYSTFNCAHGVLPDLSTGPYVTNRVQVGQFWVLLVSMQSSITSAPGYEKLFYVLNICFLILLGKKGCKSLSSHRYETYSSLWAFKLF